MFLTRVGALGAISCCAIALGMASPASAVDKLKLGSANSLSFFVAEEKGFYDEQDLEVEIVRFPSSEELRAALAAGELQLAGFGVDNALAMAEAGEADAVVVMGIENPPIQFIGNKGMTSLAELRGRTVLVDDPNTQNAVIMKRLLAREGLEPERDYSMKAAGGQPRRLEELAADPSLGGTMVSWPEFFRVKAEGYPVFGSSVDVVGPMTFQVVFTTRDWAAANSDLLRRFLTAQVKAQRWMTDPQNRDQAIALFSESRGYTPGVAADAYAALMGPTGWAPDGAVPLPELATVMNLRAEVEGAWDGKAPPPETYLDLSYLNDVISALGPN